MACATMVVTTQDHKEMEDAKIQSGLVLEAIYM